MWKRQAVAKDLQSRRGENTYGAQGNGSGSEADQAAVSGMGLMHSISVVADELLNNVADALEILGHNEVANDSLEPVCVSLKSCLRCAFGLTNSRAPTLRLS